MKRELPLERSFKLAVAASGFEPGSSRELPSRLHHRRFLDRPHRSVADLSDLRRNNEFAEVILIALLPDDGSSASFDRSSINETFKKPFDAALLAERLRTLIGAKKELV